MNRPKSSALLRAASREKLIGKYATLIGANIVLALIQMIVSSLVPAVSTGMLQIIITYVISLIIMVLLGILRSGKAYMYMNVAYEQTVTLSDIFQGFKKNADKACLIQIVFALTRMIVTVPSAIYVAIATSNPGSVNYTAVAITFLIIAIGLIAFTYVSLTFFPAFYLLQDFPDRSAKDILMISQKLMRGNRFRLLYTYVGFIPLYLVSVLGLMIPALWVSVYRDATLAEFYKDLIACNASSTQ